MAAIDQHDLAHDHLLSTVQGNILKGHGRNHTANIFIEFHADHVQAARDWLTTFAADTVTSAKLQLAQTERFKQHKVSGGLFAGLYVSWAGYDYFDVKQRPEGPDSAFALGMKNAKLEDPPVSKWEATFQDLSIHVMVLLAHHDKDELNAEVTSLLDAVRQLTLPASMPPDDIGRFLSEKIGVEYGNAIRNANGDGLEHFGYVDGISQPLFFLDEVRQDRELRAPNNAVEAWNPEADTALVLVPDHKDADTQGSFYVFRKLEQDVRAFKRAERELALKLGFVDDQLELAGAMLVGRFEDGTPVTMSGADGMIRSGSANNFDYAGDAQAMKCPFHGHIRKTNPRGAGVPGVSKEADKQRVMARRGIPYGQREVGTEFDCAPEQLPTGAGVGLLFQSFQADLGRQFEFIQKMWANNVEFPLLNPQVTGLDPLIGQGQSAGARDFVWPNHYDAAPGQTTTLSFPQLVTMKGGEYFFAPSLTTLKSFGADPDAVVPAAAIDGS